LGKKPAKLFYRKKFKTLQANSFPNRAIFKPSGKWASPNNTLPKDSLIFYYFLKAG
jgi:hypothetical protein